ncbi:MAG TPA: type II secretion system protein N [Dyella sp.]|uniref:type II secretion system protein N n=1 Tax=Dyella sp. TaxID=1869338 RepID=UPI002F94FE7E
MKAWRVGLVVLGVVLLAVVSLFWFLPARWVVPSLQARLHGLRLDGVSGSLWDGHADRLIATDGRLLGRMDWQLSRLSLFGKGALSLQLEGPQLAFRGQMQRLGDDSVHWQDVHLHLDLGLTTHATPWGRPQGTLEVDIPEALVQNQWPMRLAASGQWRDASVQTAQGKVSLGTLSWHAQSNHGVLIGSLADAGPEGPLKVSGSFELSTLGWHYRLEAVPRGRQPALQRWLTILGPVAFDGTLRLEQRGGVAKLLKGSS